MSLKIELRKILSYKRDSSSDSSVEEEISYLYSSSLEVEDDCI